MCSELIHFSIGRTGRVGNVGKATSFYGDKDDKLARDLAEMLREAGEPVPDFLESNYGGDMYGAQTSGGHGGMATAAWETSTPW